MIYLVRMMYGALIGSADVIPGVSGGTMAYMLGIYPRFIAAIAAINLQTVRLLFTLRWQEVWHAVDGAFILPIAIGALASIALLAPTIQFLLQHYQPVLFSLFLGLVLSCALVFLFVSVSHLRKRSAAIQLGVGLLVGLAIRHGISDLPINTLTIIVGGIAAAAAMLLPGISGSYLLVLLGLYPVIIDAIATFDFRIICFFTAGVALGLLLASKIIHFMLERAYHQTMVFIVGVILGTIDALWPWQVAAAPISPFAIEVNYLLFCIIAFFIGFIVFFLSFTFAKPRC